MIEVPGIASLADRSAAEWQLADWIAYQAANGMSWREISAELYISPAAARAAAKAANLFPPGSRNPNLSYRHHEALISLPSADALAMLAHAHANGLDDRETRIAAVKRKAELAPPYQREVDWEHEELVTLARAWNRARPSVRAEFIDMAEEADRGVIDP